jgi:hypothetical protein
MGLGKWAHKAALDVDRFIETNPFCRLLGIFGAIIGVGAACFAFYHIIIDLSDRHDERIIRSWDHLLKPIGGNTGKAEAIEILFGYGISIDNIEMPCPAIDDDESCKWPVIIEGLFEEKELPLKELHRDGWQDTIIGYGVIAGANFSNVHFKNTDFNQWVLERLQADNTTWRNVSFQGAYVDGSFENAFFEATDFGGALVSAEMTGAQFLLSNISGALIALGDEAGESQLSELPDFSMSWFWADQPPNLTLNGMRIDVDELNVGFVCDFDPPAGFTNLQTSPLDNLTLASIEAGSGAWVPECNAPISVAEAKQRYPLRYGASQHECSEGDQDRSRWDREKEGSKIEGC